MCRSPHSRLPLSLIREHARPRDIVLAKVINPGPCFSRSCRVELIEFRAVGGGSDGGTSLLFFL
jgi:hypothetical protein